MRRLDIFGPLADRSFRLLWLAIAGPLETAFGADEVLVAAAVVAVVANVIPATLPAVRAVIRHRDGTITGPPAAA